MYQKREVKRATFQLVGPPNLFRSKQLLKQTQPPSSPLSLCLSVCLSVFGWLGAKFSLLLLDSLNKLRLSLAKRNEMKRNAWISCPPLFYFSALPLEGSICPTRASGRRRAGSLKSSPEPMYFYKSK